MIRPLIGSPRARSRLAPRAGGRRTAPGWGRLFGAGCHKPQKRRTHWRTAHGVCLLLWVGCAVALGQTSTGSDLKPIPVKERQRGEKVSYSLQIAEVLESKCTGCHGSVLAEKRFSLESVAGMLKGG